MLYNKKAIFLYNDLYDQCSQRVGEGSEIVLRLHAQIQGLELMAQHNLIKNHAS